ncbi:MAG: hypothetical protein HKN93_05635 [Acidimicrobiia bacterium]|nr:hypothetical protein [Acidimicrobiia bacterium]
MALTGYEVDINLPAPPQRERGLLLDAAQSIPPDEIVRSNVNRAWLGVKWMPWGTDMLDLDASDCDVGYNFTADEPVLRRVPDELIQPAFLMWDALKCSTISSTPEWLRARVVRNLRVYASAAFAGELATAAASGGLAITGTNLLTPNIINATAQSIRLSMYHLETHLASVLHGAAGMIHVSSGLLGLLVADDLAEWDGRVYRSASGHIVVGDPGWTGQYTPYLSSAATGDQEWMYATAPIWYAISEVNTTEILTDDPGDTNLLKNMNQPFAKRHGVITWDPSATGAIKVTVA